MTDIKSMTQEEITDALRAMGEPAFRGKQVFSWLHKGATDFAEMNNLSKPLREKLGKEFTITAPTVARKQVSQLDGTVKYLWELRDGNCIETVLMSYHHGNTVCISSQVGCRMGCKFCASTIAGKVRDLTPSEILDQVIFAQKDSGLPISNIVLMGIGEPLDNFDNVMDFIRIANNPFGLGIGARHITVSTCGLPKGIIEYGKLGIQTNLALSLHAPNDEIRNKIMPISKAYDLDTVFKALEEYYATSGRRITLEYIMLKGLNDSRENAKELAALIHKYKVLCYVNLIPYNEVKEMPFRRSEMTTCRNFVTTLMQNGINATIRKEFGGDIDAACGQLRVKVEKNRG